MPLSKIGRVGRRETPPGLGPLPTWANLDGGRQGCSRWCGLPGNGKHPIPIAGKGAHMNWGLV